MHVLWIILGVLGGLIALAIIILAVSATSDGSNPFQ